MSWVSPPGATRAASRSFASWKSRLLAVARPSDEALSRAGIHLITYDRQDVMVPSGHGAWLAAHVPTATGVVADAGHLPGPDALIQQISEVANGL